MTNKNWNDSNRYTRQYTFGRFVVMAKWFPEDRGSYPAINVIDGKDPLLLNGNYDEVIEGYIHTDSGFKSFKKSTI